MSALLRKSRSSRPELAQAGVVQLAYHALSTGRERRLDLGWERGLSWQGEFERPSVMPLPGGFLALLADACAALRLAEKAADERVRALNLLHTTAAARLQQVWSAVAGTRWRTAREALAQALELDPADARGF